MIGSYQSLQLQAEYAGRLLFTASDAEHGDELWYSNGTPETTAIWSDLNPGSASSDPSGFFVDGPFAYFSANTAATGRELWTITYPGAPPQLIDVIPGAESSRPSRIVNNGDLYFTAITGVYRLDSQDQAVLVDATLNLNSDSPDKRLLQTGSAGLYFIDDVNSAPRNELRHISGANNAVSIVRGGFESIHTFAGQLNGRPLFLADDNGSGVELWISDGTESGTHMVRDIQHGTVDSQPDQLQSVNGHLVFTGQKDSGYWLAQAESGFVRDLSVRYPQAIPIEAGSFNGDLTGVYWRTFVTESGGDPFWALTTWDGSQFRVLVRLPGHQDVNLALNPPVKLAQYGTIVAIVDYAVSPSSTTLWTIGADGALKERLGTFDNMAQHIWETADGKLFFAQYDPTDTYLRLWETDGTVGGTRMVPNIPAFDGFGTPVFGPGFFMAQTVDPHGVIFANTATGDVSTEENFFDNETTYMYRLGETPAGLLFARNGTELWSTAGTALSTRRIPTLPAGKNVLSKAISTTDSVWFFASSFSDSTQLALWKSDGTVDGTNQAVQLPTWKILVSDSFTKVGERFIFATTDQQTGKSEVWLSDGTSHGTFVISDNLIIGDFTRFVKYDQGIAFVAATPAVGREVFRIDTTIPVAPPTGITVDRQGTEPRVQWADSRGAVQYDVWLTNLSDPTTPVFRQRVNAPMFDLPEGANANAYRIWIRSVPVIGEPSAWSRPYDFTPGLNPVVYSLPAVTADTTPTFSWVGSGNVTSYELWVSHLDTKTRPIYMAGLTTTSFTPPSALALGRYAVWVRATRTNGTRSDWSAPKSFDILLPAIRLTSVGVSRSSRPLFTWNTVAGATHYELSVRRSDGSIAYTATGIRGVSHALVQDLAAGSYSVVVQAMNGVRPLTIAGPGDALSVLLPPKILTATNVGISWTSVSEAVTYTMELRNAAGQSYVPRMTVAQPSVGLTPPLVPGQYSVRIFSNFRNGSSDWTASFPFEVFRPATRITSSNAPTADATPIISWAPVAGASGYEIQAARTAAGPAVYTRTGITTANHRIETALPAGVNFITVRALFADGSRTYWSAPQQLMIGPAPTLTYSGQTVSWNPVNQATHFELWINFLGTPQQQKKIVYNRNYLTNNYQLPSTLPRGRYQVWLRAVRAEGGELYAGLWASVSIDLK
jgi:ELWxxDGT repeat protein